MGLFHRSVFPRDDQKAVFVQDVNNYDIWA
jgi:hypothetical protein